MIHQYYKLITPETKEFKVEAEDLVEDSKEEDSQAEASKEEGFKVEAADRLKNNITNTIHILQKNMLAQ